MKLIHAQLRRPNFGDDLNLWLWPRLLPGVFDADDSTLFLGIGSILNHRFDGPTRKLVMGAAFVADYGRAPDLNGGDYRIYFVRGPRTAAALGLDPALAIGDPAVLVGTLLPRGGGEGPVCFMPHWESHERGYWAKACVRAGVTLIDPTAPVEAILAQISGARLMLCEAMHGAIVADALRVPWIPLLPIDPRNRAKWADWADSLALSIVPRRIAASSPAEWLARATQRPDVLAAARAVMDAWPLAPVRWMVIARAAGRLRALARAPGPMSDEGVLERVKGRMLEVVARFRADYGPDLPDRPWRA
jgi:succinoglycan biosynthesis protein ExoV